MRTVASQDHRNRPGTRDPATVPLIGSLLQGGAEEGQLVPEVIRLLLSSRPQTTS